MLIIGFFLRLLVKLAVLPLKAAVYILLAAMKVAAHILKAALHITANFLHFILLTILRRVVPLFIAAVTMIPGLLASKKLTRTMAVTTIFEVVGLLIGGGNPLILGLAGFVGVVVSDHLVNQQPWVASGVVGMLWGSFRGLVIVAGIAIPVLALGPAVGGFVAIAVGLVVGTLLGGVEEAIWESVVSPT